MRMKSLYFLLLMVEVKLQYFPIVESHIKWTLIS